MFWTKCGKLIAENNKLINCNNSPCNYYSVFGIKYRYLNYETMQPNNDCNWYYSVFASEIKNSSIQWNDMYSICIPVKSKIGLVANKKIKEGCWMDCSQWDQNGCINEYQYCDFCIEYEVYNLAGCFDEYNSFAQFFYEKCGRTPDSNGKYPNIFQTSYGNVYMTGEANECVENYWKKYFYDMASVNYQITVNYKQQLWWIYGYYRDGVYQTQYQCNCDGQYSMGKQPCADGCSQYEYEYMVHETSVGSCAHRQDRSDVKIYISGGGFWGYSDQCWNQNQPCYVQNCYDRNLARDKISEVWDLVYSSITDKTAYNNNGTSQHNCINSGSLCNEFSYKSLAFDNYYGDTDSVRYRFQWATLSLSKNSNTPQWAKGIKFKAQLTRYKRNQGYDRRAEQKIVSQEEIVVYFNQEYTDLPFTSYLTPASYIQKQDCDAGNHAVQIQPYPIYSWAGNYYPHDNKTDQYNYRFIAVEYVK